METVKLYLYKYSLKDNKKYYQEVEAIYEEAQNVFITDVLKQNITGECLFEVKNKEKILFSVKKDYLYIYSNQKIDFDSLIYKYFVKNLSDFCNAKEIIVD